MAPGRQCNPGRGLREFNRLERRCAPRRAGTHDNTTRASAGRSISFDQPLFVGDFITADDFQGTAEHVGVKSTRLSSICGERTVPSNSDLLESRLRNGGRMREPRVLFTIGGTNETAVELLERIPQILRTVIEATADTRFHRCRFSNHNSASLDFETVERVLAADCKRHRDVQQEMRLRRQREFARLGIEFAYAAQRLILERAGAPVTHHPARIGPRSGNPHRRRAGRSAAPLKGHAPPKGHAPQGLPRQGLPRHQNFPETPEKLPGGIDHKRQTAIIGLISAVETAGAGQCQGPGRRRDPPHHFLKSAGAIGDARPHPGGLPPVRGSLRP